VSAIRRGDGAYLEDLQRQGHDPRRIAAHIVWNALNQIYRFGYFHADPHPANLLVLDDDAIGYVDFGIVGKLDDRTTESLRYFAQSLFAGHTDIAVREFMRFLTPSSHTRIEAAHRDLIEAMTNYVESARVGPDGLFLTENIFEIEMLAVVRKHAMRLAPDAVRYLKAVLTAEAMVRELDPQFDLRATENRFFGRLMELEAIEAFDPRRLGQRLLDARVRADRILRAIETINVTGRDLLGVTLRVRQRVQWFLATMIGGLAIVLIILAISQPSAGLRSAAIATLIAIVLLGFAIVEVRRLPSEPEVDHRSRYPHRVP
jgi:ubiquinone biosynthesis protein